MSGHALLDQAALLGLIPGREHPHATRGPGPGRTLSAVAARYAVASSASMPAVPVASASCMRTQSAIVDIVLRAKEEERAPSALARGGKYIVPSGQREWCARCGGFQVVQDEVELGRIEALEDNRKVGVPLIRLDKPIAVGVHLLHAIEH